MTEPDLQTEWYSLVPNTGKQQCWYETMDLFTRRTAAQEVCIWLRSEPWKFMWDSLAPSKE